MTAEVNCGRLRPLALLVGAGIVLTAGAHEATASTLSANAGTFPCVSDTSTCRTNLGTMAGGTQVAMQCWIDGRNATGTYTTVRWFLVRRPDGYEAFVHASYIPAPGQPGGQTTVMPCTNSVRVKAGLAAAARIGQTNPSASDVALGGWRATGPVTDGNALGPYGDWAGDRIKFAWVAYRRAGLTLARGNAWPVFKSSYDTSTVRGTNRLPRYGALVGWNWNPGHIAVAVGGNRVATTMGLDRTTAGTSPKTSLQQLTSTMTFGGSGYTGWAVPRGA